MSIFQKRLAKVQTKNEYYTMIFQNSPSKSLFSALKLKIIF
jgi:hypothetical protein